MMTLTWRGEAQVAAVAVEWKTQVGEVRLAERVVHLRDRILGILCSLFCVLYLHMMKSERLHKDVTNTLTGDMTRLLTCSTMGRWTESVLVTRVTLLPVHLSAW